MCPFSQPFPVRERREKTHRTCEPITRAPKTQADTKWNEISYQRARPNRAHSTFDPKVQAWFLLRFAFSVLSLSLSLMLTIFCVCFTLQYECARVYCVFDCPKSPLSCRGVFFASLSLSLISCAWEGHHPGPKFSFSMRGFVSPPFHTKDNGTMAHIQLCSSFSLFLSRWLVLCVYSLGRMRNQANLYVHKAYFVQLAVIECRHRWAVGPTKTERERNRNKKR